MYYLKNTREEDENKKYIIININNAYIIIVLMIEEERLIKDLTYYSDKNVYFNVKKAYYSINIPLLIT